MRSDKERLLDLLEAIKKIEDHKTAHKVGFEADEMLQVWTVHYLQIIGEAASRVSNKLRAEYSEIPWGKFIGTRQILVHDYFEIDLDIVWTAVDVDLPALKAQIEKVLSDISQNRS